MSVNKVILIGNVGKDPEVRQLDSGVKVATFSLATTERGYTLQNGTQVPDRTEWHNIVLWRGLADTAEKYVKKGSKIYIEGMIRTRSYEDQNKIRRSIVEIFGNSMELLGAKPQNQVPPPAEYPTGQQTVRQPVQQYQSQQYQPNQYQPQSGYGQYHQNGSPQPQQYPTYPQGEPFAPEQNNGGKLPF